MSNEAQFASILIWVAMYLIGNCISRTRAQLVTTLIFFGLHALLVAAHRIFS